MKNNFVATFILLAVGLVFNDVASVHGKPTKRQIQQQIQQINSEATNAGFVFNAVGSVEEKPTKRNLTGWQDWQVTQVNLAGTDAIYRCNGTFTNYKESQACYKAAQIRGALVESCVATDPIACKLLSVMDYAEFNAFQVEQAKIFRRAGS